MVSIILSNLNTAITFVEERLKTIFNQTYTDWECIVIDGFSNNGSWEYIKKATRNNVRFKLYQLPKKGIYNAWNEGIKRANGEFIYIAPSDDTMENDFLKKTIQTLEAYTECDIAHCCLNIIDENGEKSDKNWDAFNNLRYFNDEVKQKHIRYAPLDGFLHAMVGMMYTSITQLLIRKKVFDTIGNFLTDHGSIADFEWEMRASLIFNTIHIPEYLATWRVHKDQATSDELLGTGFLYEKNAFFIKHAVESNRLKKLLPVPINIKELQYDNLWLAFRVNLRNTQSKKMRIKLISSFFITYPYDMTIFFVRRILGFKENHFTVIRNKIRKFDLEKHVKII